MPLFPPPEKRGEIAFVFAKSMPYGPRMAVVAAALLCGLSVQLLFSFWLGLLLLALASAMGMVSGYDSKPDTGREIKWERVTPDEYRKIIEKADALKKWDSDAFDISNPAGTAVFLLAVLACFAAYFAVLARMELPEGFWKYLGIDAAVLLLPLWLTGIRDYLKKDRLVIKINLLQQVLRLLEAPSDVQVFPTLGLQYVAGGKHSPDDARLLVKLLGAPEEFMGLQVQVSINSVKGTDFPYLYCVLIAKKGSGFLDGYEKFKAGEEPGLGASVLSFLGLSSSRGLVYEKSPSPEVDVLVIRQHADRNGGYSTSPDQAWKVVTAGVNVARGLAGKAAAGAA